MNLPELLKLKFPDADFLRDICIEDRKEGHGPEIKEWNLQDIPRPSKDDIDQWMKDFDLQYRQQQVMLLRKVNYPSWNHQMQMQYNDLINHTTTWKDAIAAIKATYPIPME